MKKIKVLYFSPVGSTKAIVNYIVEGLGHQDLEWYDLTQVKVREKEILFSCHDLVIMCFPVYAGRIVRVPRYMLKNMKGNGAKVVTVVTYGNRAYDDALLELSHLVRQAGFEQLGAAAFVGEHSFGIGLASGRPDISDRNEARLFGKSIMEQLGNPSVLDINLIPGQYPPRTQFRHDFGGPLIPVANDTCIDCKKCAMDCPLEAIDISRPRETDQKKCITCYRCIRKCPVGARSIALDDFKKHVEMLASDYQERKEIETYI